MQQQVRLIEVDTGRVVVAHLRVATTLWQRSVGLLGQASLAADEALWLEPCTGIHTFGMRSALDVLFLDKTGLAMHAISHLPPLRACGPLWKARVVVELPGGALDRQRIATGKRYVKSAV